MALESMGYIKQSVNGTVEILWNSEYVGDKMTLDTTAFTDGVCKAGTPMALGGTKATGDAAFGILLHDVYQERPQGTVVIGGYINTTVAEEHSGVTISETVKTALKNVVFMNGGED